MTELNVSLYFLLFPYFVLTLNNEQRVIALCISPTIVRAKYLYQSRKMKKLRDTKYNIIEAS